MILATPDNLACPICGEHLTQSEQRWFCSRNHSFDRARQGYVNLLPVQHKNSREPGDSKKMVLARQAFLDSGIYEPIAQSLVAQLKAQLGPDSGDHLCILDAGSGEGYYLNYLANALFDTWRQDATRLTAIGLDISKDAVIAAARRNRQLQWIVGTNVHPPVMPGSVDFLLCLFGFPSFRHFRPLLREGGVVILADPGPDHLIELRELIYPEVRRSPVSDLGEADLPGLRLKNTETLHFTTAALNREQVQHLLTMTPHLYRASHEGKQAAARLETITLTVEVVFRILEIKP